MDTFFQHENHARPSSLASSNSMHQNKGDFLQCIESLVSLLEETPHIKVKIVNGAALLHTLDPKKCQDFP